MKKSSLLLQYAVKMFVPPDITICLPPIRSKWPLPHKIHFPSVTYGFLSKQHVQVHCYGSSPVRFIVFTLIIVHDLGTVSRLSENLLHRLLEQYQVRLPWAMLHTFAYYQNYTDTNQTVLWSLLQYVWSFTFILFYALPYL